MGTRGPLPKRSDQRRRRNKGQEPDKAPAGTVRAEGPPPKSGKGSGTAAWVAYARSLGLTVPDGAKRADVIALVERSDDTHWHPLAQRWFDSLSESGQSAFYEASDWATAAIVAESMSRELNAQVVGTTKDGDVIRAKVPPKGASLAAWLKAFNVLLVTEGDRRRMGVELEKAGAGGGEEGAREVVSLSDYRDRLTQPG